MAKFALLSLMGVAAVAAVAATEQGGGDGYYDPCLAPVIMLPGLGGSILDYSITEDFKPVNSICEPFYPPVGEWSEGLSRLWPSSMVMGPPSQYECWEAEMITYWDFETKELNNYPGLLTRVRDWGGVEGIDNLFKVTDDWGPQISSIYDQLIKEMDPLGWEPHLNLRGAPYDFRLFPHPDHVEAFVKDLKELVEDSYEKSRACPSGPLRAHMIGHSMGGPVLQQFFTQYEHLGVDAAWKDMYIESSMSVGSGYTGSLKSLRAALSGDSQGLPGGNQKYQYAETTMLGVAWMMPNPYIESNHRDMVELRHSDGTADVYDMTEADQRKLLESREIPHFVDMWDTWVLPVFQQEIVAPGVEMYCVHGSGLVTEDYYVYEGDFDRDPIMYRETYTDGSDDTVAPDEDLEMPYGRLDKRKEYRDDPEQGDGTVILDSMTEICQNWVGNNNGEPVHVVEFAGLGHVTTLTSDEFAEYAMGIWAAPQRRK